MSQYVILRLPNCPAGKLQFDTVQSALEEATSVHADHAQQVLKGFKEVRGHGYQSIGRVRKLLTSQTVSGFLAREYNKALDLVQVRAQRLCFDLLACIAC